MEDVLKKIMLAGIGSLATTYEKSKSMIDELVKKGELTVDQGKQLNEELKKTVEKDQKDENGELFSEIKEYIDSLNLATKSDIDNLSSRIDDIEKRN